MRKFVLRISIRFLNKYGNLQYAYPSFSPSNPLYFLGFLPIFLPLFFPIFPIPIFSNFFLSTSSFFLLPFYSNPLSGCPPLPSTFSHFFVLSIFFLFIFSLSFYFLSSYFLYPQRVQTCRL